MLYELHVGTFTPEGTFAGTRPRLAYLAELGVTGGRADADRRVLGLAQLGLRRRPALRARRRSYGSPDDLKALVDEAHGLGLMVFLDVVYNHFGPEGNYLALYAPQFFTERVQDALGGGDRLPASAAVRDFFIENALYWLEEFRFDGLRFDAVHAIMDASPTHILVELAATVRERLARSAKSISCSRTRPTRPASCAATRPRAGSTTRSGTTTPTTSSTSC